MEGGGVTKQCVVSEDTMHILILTNYPFLLSSKFGFLPCIGRDDWDGWCTAVARSRVGGRLVSEQRVVSGGYKKRERSAHFFYLNQI